MTTHWFDALSKEIPEQPLFRRSVLAGLAGSMLGLIAGGPSDLVAKEKKDNDKKRKKKPLQRNEFGCVPVGKHCRGNDSVCCSGVCDGKKPKKGERDRSECVPHDTGGCVKGQQSGFCHAGSMGTPCTSSAGHPGTCETTTGNAGFCVATGSCTDCDTD
ncbi:MAG: hypothetical protein U0075_08530 [Thermomicrobiales bacterium]